MGSMDEVFNSSPSVFDEFPLDLIFTRIAAYLSEYENKFEDEEPQRVSRIANTGAEFNFFKPRHQGSIYYRLIMDPNCVEELATSLIEKWELDDKTATVEMIQLFADVAGIQDIKIAECFGTVDYSEIVKRMRNNISPNYENAGYLLVKQDNWVKRVTLTLTNFVKTCVKMSEQKGGLFKDIFGDVFVFLSIFCKSQVQAFKHTGLFFVINFCIAIGKITRGHTFVLSKFRDIAEYNDDYQTQLANKIERCENELDICLRYTKYFASIILKELLRYQGMKMLYELYAKNVPLLYISGDDDLVKKRFISSLISYLSHPETDKITLIAIDSLTTMLKDERNTFDQIDGSNIINELYKLTLDYNLKIGTNAIRALCAATERYMKFFTEELKWKLFLFMYNKNSVLGKEAGRLFMHVQRQMNEDVKGILLDMANYRISLPLYKNVPEDFVESVIDEAHELSNFEAIIEMLLRDESLEFEQEVALLEIFTHAIIIKITGISLKPRVDSKKVFYDPEDIIEVLSEMLPVLPKLFQKYSTEVQCLNNLLLIMKKLPYDDAILTQFQEKLYQIIKLYPKIFETTNDKNVLISISENLQQLSSELSPIQTLSLATVKCITEKNLDEYECDVNRPWTKDVQYHISDILAKLAALRKFHAPFENEMFIPLKQLKQQCNERVLANELEYEVNFLSQKVYKHTKDGNNDDKSLTLLRSMYDHFCDELCQNLLIFVSMESITIVLNSFVDIHVCLESTGNLSKDPLSENQVEIICLSIRKRLENKDEDSVKLLTKLLNCLHSLTGPVSLYVLALFNKFHHLYGNTFERLFASAFKISCHKTCALITGTIHREITNLQNQRLAVCENFTEIRELAARFFITTPTENVRVMATSWLRLSAKATSYFPMLELIEYLCNQNILTKDDCKFLAPTLLSLKFSSEEHDKIAKKIYNTLRKH